MLGRMPLQLQGCLILSSVVKMYLTPLRISVSTWEVRIAPMGIMHYQGFGHVPAAALHYCQAGARVHMLYSNTFIYTASIYPLQPAPNNTDLLRGC